MNLRKLHSQSSEDQLKEIEEKLDQLIDFILRVYEGHLEDCQEYENWKRALTERYKLPPFKGKRSGQGEVSQETTLATFV